MKHLFTSPKHSNLISLALVLLRVSMGVAFILHGWDKIQTPFSWLPAGAPLAIPGFFQFLAAFSEFAGGIALIIGLLTSITSLGLMVTMAVAVYFHAVIGGDPFVAKGGGSYELPLIYLGISLLFFATGPGKYSLDNLFFGPKKS